jgi:hypothetical protein
MPTRQQLVVNTGESESIFFDQVCANEKIRVREIVVNNIELGNVLVARKSYEERCSSVVPRLTTVFYDR